MQDQRVAVHRRPLLAGRIEKCVGAGRSERFGAGRFVPESSRRRRLWRRCPQPPRSSPSSFPFAAGLSLLGTVPMGLLAYRYRIRVLFAATVAGGLIAFLVAGMGGMMTVFQCAYIGALIGLVKRRRRGTPTVIVVALCAGVVSAC